MKSLLEEYGTLVVSAIVIMILVVFAPFIGKHIGKGTETTVATLTSKLNESPNEDSGGETAPLKGEAFAVFSADDGSLCFYRDESIPAEGEAYRGKTATNVYTGIENDGYSPGWEANKPNIVSVNFIDKVQPKTTYYWFASCKATTEIHLANLDTSNVTNMSGMFAGCRILPSLNLSHFNTSNVTDMSDMFIGCRNLQTLDLSDFDTSKVTDMRNMFTACNELENLNISSFATENVTDMSMMFQGCFLLKELNVKHFNTSKVTTMSNMFDGCRSLINFDVTSFDISKCTSMKAMFSNCTNMETLDLSSFDMAHLNYRPSNMFLNNSKLSTVYCRTQEDANIFEKCIGNPPSISFQIK